MATGDIREYTSATLRMRAEIDFQGVSANEVFATLGDPERITDWYLLAKEVHLHAPVNGQEQSFDVEFTFFGTVFEEILYWDPPRCYVYQARGADFPISDYVARIEVQEQSRGVGTMRWEIYFDTIAGQHFQRILPVMLPEINRASMEKLARLIKGVAVRCESFFD